jgi:hypothetical protein
VLVALTYETSLELAQLAGLVLTEPDVDAALTRVTQVAVSVVAPVRRRLADDAPGRRAGRPAASDDWASGLDELQFASRRAPA